MTQVRASRILLIGAGGLGGPAALGLLSLPGRMHLTLLDDDVVDVSNLSRQMFYFESCVGRPKAQVLAAALEARRPGITVEARVERFDAANAAALVRTHDLVVDGSDLFETRFLANDACVRSRRPLVHGAALGWRGQVMLVEPGRTPCLRCVFEAPPVDAPTCADAGVAAPLVGVVGGWMAEAARVVLAGGDDRWRGAMRTLDAVRGRERFVPLGRDPACAACAALG
ncbi:MAG: hypothetical protein RL199_922 [Pseudomonadota bacterium]|jgi:adenylyltransferase/sulfurtransferase